MHSPLRDGGEMKSVKQSWQDLDRAALIPALMVFAVHAVLGARYDIFRDELYFIVCGQHPSFGYVDQPPLVPIMAAALYKLSPAAWCIRLPVALAAGALVWLAARFCRFLGGYAVSVALAALAAAIAPLLMGLTSTLNTSAFDPLAWTAIAYCLVRAIREDIDSPLRYAGVIAGLALQIKYAVLFWILGLAVGLLLTPERRLLLRPAFWQSVALMAVIAVPSFIWQLGNGFPFLELAAAAKAKNADIALLPFIGNQVFVMNPAFAPLWLSGLCAPFLVKSLKDLRFLVIAAITVVVIVRMGHGKDYYLAPLYPTLFVIGAVALARFWRHVRGKTFAIAVAAIAVVISAIAVPLALPVLSPPALVAYMARLGIAPQQQERSFKGTALPQVFADQLGWHDFTNQVEAAWNQIPRAQRSATGIKADNYGEAAALDLYGKGLPPALSGHNQYYLWGLRGQHPRDLLVIQESIAVLEPYCAKVTVLGTTASTYAIAYENGKVIALCEGVKPPLESLWPLIKNYN